MPTRSSSFLRTAVVPLLASASLSLACARPSATIVLPEDSSAAPPTVAQPEVEEVPPEPIDLKGVRAQPVHGFVALPGDAELHFEPSAEAGVGRLESKGDSAALVAWRVLGDGGEYVEVESLVERQRTPDCLDSPFYGDAETALERYRLRAWVERDELALVTATELRLAFGDRSSITIGAGVPIGVDENETWLSTRGLALELELPLSGLGLSWAQTGLSNPPEPNEAGYFNHDPEMSLDGEPVLIARLDAPLGEARGFSVLSPGVALWEFADACIRLELIGPPASEEAYGIGGLGLVGTGRGGSTRPRWKIPAGTIALWPNGRQAGVSLADHTVFEERTEVRGSMRCFKLAGSVDICHAVGDLIHLP